MVKVGVNTETNLTSFYTVYLETSLSHECKYESDQSQVSLRDEACGTMTKTELTNHRGLISF